MNWYYVQDSDRVGPVDDAELERLAAAGRIQPETLVWNETLPGWTPLHVARPGFPSAPPPTYVETGREGPAVAPLSVCSRCGNAFPPDQLMSFEGKSVCVQCKPLFLARLREGVPEPGRLEYAGLWVRFGAKFVDGLILGASYFLVALLLLPSMTARAGPRRGSPDAFLLPCLIQVAFYGLSAVYYTWFIGRYGATPGKMALKLRVVMADGSPVPYKVAAGRFFSELLSALLLYIGYLLAAFDEEKRTLHDRTCNPRVIRA